MYLSCSYTSLVSFVVLYTCTYGVLPAFVNAHGPQSSNATESEFATNWRQIYYIYIYITSFSICARSRIMLLWLYTDELRGHGCSEDGRQCVYYLYAAYLGHPM